MPVAWHPKRWWSFCVSEDEKKEIDPIFIKDLWKCTSLVYIYIETFCLLRYWNILSSTFIKILNYIISLWIIFILNWSKYFDKKSDNILSKTVSILETKYDPGGHMF